MLHSVGDPQMNICYGGERQRMGRTPFSSARKHYIKKTLFLLWRWCLLDNDVSDGVAMMAMVAIMGLVLAIMVSSMVRPPPKSATNIIPT